MHIIVKQVLIRVRHHRAAHRRRLCDVAQSVARRVPKNFIECAGDVELINLRRNLRIQRRHRRRQLRIKRGGEIVVCIARRGVTVVSRREAQQRQVGDDDEPQRSAFSASTCETRLLTMVVGFCPRLSRKSFAPPQTVKSCDAVEVLALAYCVTWVPTFGKEKMENDVLPCPVFTPACANRIHPRSCAVGAARLSEPASDSTHNGPLLYRPLK